jgi:tRNA(Ile)-lysidine synthase
LQFKAEKPTMYHGTVQKLAEFVHHYISKERLLKPGDRLGVAVSGGADSVALLRLMIDLRKELGVVLSVIHFNHKLRGADAEADEKFVKEISAKHGLEFFCQSGDAASNAEHEHLSIEAAARALRYEYFVGLLQKGKCNRIATAHTLDDQAETVLLKLARGAGTRGLAGIYPKLVVGHQADTSIVRPLLAIRRKQLESFVKALAQDWREDKSNRDLRHSRNLVRHGILPRLEHNLNPAVREALAETADIARAEEEYWTSQVADFMPQVWKSPDDGPKPPSGALNLSFPSAQPLALQRRLIRAAAESLGFQLEFKHVEQILHLGSNKSRHPQSTILPGGWKATHTDNVITLNRSAEPLPVDYEYHLPIPGKIRLPQAGKLIETLLLRPGDKSGYNPDHAFDPALLTKELLVRNWRPGDRFWPGHSKSPKKVKELLQERHLTGMERKLFPVVVSGTEVIWMGDFPVPSQLRPRDSNREVVIIRETVLEDY